MAAQDPAVVEDPLADPGVDLAQSGQHLADGGPGDLDPAGLYFGTRTGQLFASSDEGDSWQALAEWLPPVVCVKAAVVP